MADAEISRNALACGYYVAGSFATPARPFEFAENVGYASDLPFSPFHARVITMKFGRLISICLKGALLGTMAMSTIADAKPRKKNPPKYGDKDRAKGDPDRKNNVDGAIWNFSAEHPETKKIKTFQYRANGAVLYDGNGKVIGGVKNIGKGKSQATFGKDSPLEGTANITKNKFGHWAGSFTDKEGTNWKVMLDSVDR